MFSDRSRTDLVYIPKWEGKQGEKRKHSSDNYNGQTNNNKHGGSEEATSCVSDILKHANETLYDTPSISLDNTIFIRDSPVTRQSITNDTDNATASQDLIHLHGNRNTREDNLTVRVPPNFDQGIAQGTTNNDILQYLMIIDSKISAMDKRLSKLDAMEREIANLGAEINKMWTYVYDNINHTKSKLDETQIKVESVEFALGIINDKVTQLQKEKDSLHSDLLYLQSQSMRSSLIFSRLPEEENEKPERTEVIVSKFMSDQLKIAEDIVNDIKFEQVQCMGTKSPVMRDGRNIVAKFSLFKDREMVK